MKYIVQINNLGQWEDMWEVSYLGDARTWQVRYKKAGYKCRILIETVKRKVVK